MTPVGREILKIKSKRKSKSTKVREDTTRGSRYEPSNRQQAEKTERRPPSKKKETNKKGIWTKHTNKIDLKSCRQEN
jgi:hypothetical protein